jgi:hypothetical protein
VKHPRSLSATYRRIRADGWTPERRVTFCVNLAGSRSVTFAAASVGLSHARRLAEAERDLFFATLGKTSARRIVARPNRLTLLPTSENSPTLDVSKSA